MLVAVASFGGPLALGGLYGPQSIDDVTGSAGWIVLVALVGFAALLAIWLRFARDVAGPAGLSGFVGAALGRPAGVVHAAVWTASYALYLVYTSVYVVYDLLPVAVPGVQGARPWFAVALPVVVAALLVSGRAPIVSAIGVLAIGQLALLAIATVVGLVHAPTAAAFTTSAAADDATKATAGVGALFVCGSLPLFLGGEIRRPRVVMPRALLVGFVLTGVLVFLATYPYARHPAYTHGAIPAMTVVDNESSHGLAVAVGLGVAASVVGVMLVEGLVLTRLVHSVTGRSTRFVAIVLAAALVVAAPISLIDPDRFYDDLLRPSLILLWIAQIGVVLAFVVYVIRRRLRAVVWMPVSTVAAALVGYALVTTVQGSGST